MGKKRKHSETEAAAPAKKDDSAPERPKRTLLGWKDKNEDAEESKAKAASASGFRNKEKVLVTCSRRISFRYRHLMLNMVSLRAVKAQLLMSLLSLRALLPACFSR
ncbi:hypothetical protein HID58_044044 [Brassica napus]|uniref:Uncharacterized protein n=2 Tax=Brassica TaxID=3705 RepID=A0ABQ8BI89_BRANA|nr:hypothetical protein HID58_044044 [Brassica napus]